MNAIAPVSCAVPIRRRLVVRGVVQGVGFRPFVYRLACELNLVGWVGNDGNGVAIEVEGARAAIAEFTARLRTERPEHAAVHRVEAIDQGPHGGASFTIRSSADSGPATTPISPDLATCEDCLRELRDPRDRRHLYPFINCTNCGPRFSILHALPYDRPNTSMRVFPMCDLCRAEYEDPADRRFHAQPIACSACGPSLTLWDDRGATIAKREDALAACAGSVRDGAIVAIKGLGGFHLVCDARIAETVQRLRKAKHRPDKPFAIMLPSVAAVREHCRVCDAEAELLSSPAAPIVLLDRRGDGPGLSEAVAPGVPSLGVMLPSTPLHHLLLAEIDAPIVATSGNRADEPLCIDERDALERLAGIADLFLVNDRPIVRPLDDSIVRFVAGGEQVLRRARGLAPRPIRVDGDLPPLLAVGGHQKCAVGISLGRSVVLSQHLGDLDAAESRELFDRTVDELMGLYEHRPCAVSCDEHPDYASTRFAERGAAQTGVPVIRIQHHFAHVVACMAEHELDGPVLGVAWDGTGWGPDRTVWGGEFLRVDKEAERVAHLRPFPLPGGDQAVREPRRSAVAVLAAARDQDAPATAEFLATLGWRPEQVSVLRRMLRRGVNSPRTSSAGRLFDAAASLLGIRHVCSYEGQAAIEFEHAASRSGADEAYPIDLAGAELDWRPTIERLLSERAADVNLRDIAARFHHGLAEGIVMVARRTGLKRVILTGGCFQNRFLLERTIRRLRDEGFAPYWPQLVPPNDGGLALGQIVAAAKRLARSTR